MKTIYIRRLNGDIIAIPEDSICTMPTFYKSGMCKVSTNTMTYIVPSYNIEIMADEENEVIAYFS